MPRLFYPPLVEPGVYILPWHQKISSAPNCGRTAKRRGAGVERGVCGRCGACATANANSASYRKTAGGADGKVGGTARLFAREHCLWRIAFTAKRCAHFPTSRARLYAQRPDHGGCHPCRRRGGCSAHGCRKPRRCRHGVCRYALCRTGRRKPAHRTRGGKQTRPLALQLRQLQHRKLLRKLRQKTQLKTRGRLA